MTSDYKAYFVSGWGETLLLFHDPDEDTCKTEAIKRLSDAKYSSAEISEFIRENRLEITLKNKSHIKL